MLKDGNGLFSSSKKLHFQNKAKCKFYMHDNELKLIFHIKSLKITLVLRLRLGLNGSTPVIVISKQSFLSPRDHLQSRPARHPLCNDLGLSIVDVKNSTWRVVFGVLL